jgi:2-polyprenyl-3-methyl-5-hydroxy-6-metoxy-1,4-benzoquinol methylase
MNYQFSNSGDYHNYTAYRSSPLHRNRLGAIIDMLASRFPDPKQTSVLDIGCGTGNITSPVAALGYNVRGIDIHEGSIEAARKHTPFPNAHFDTASLQDIDLSGFNAIILTEVLEHVDEADKLLTHIASNISPGALFILTVPNGWSIVEIACRPSYILKRSKVGAHLVKAIKSILGSKDLTTANEQTPHVQFFTFSRLNCLFRKNGLRICYSHAFFFAWSFWEVFFTQRCSETWARRDFLLASHLPEKLRAVWCFGLERDKVKS